jgi:CheY-like chemotaxis protein
MGYDDLRESLPLESNFRFLRKPIRYKHLINSIKKVLPGVSNSLKLSAAAAAATPSSPREGNAIPSNIVTLIAEDNTLMRGVLQKMISDIGGRCTVTSNGEECFNEFRLNQNYDIIILDCNMPVMNGFQASFNIRQYEKQNKLKPTPIIALTANKNDSIHNDCKSYGMDDCLIKPVKRKTLLYILNKYWKLALNNEPLNPESPLSELVSVKNRPNMDCRFHADFSSLLTVMTNDTPSRILLVEDNELIASITEKVLTQNHYKVKRAIHGQEALALITSNYDQYDIVLMDIFMPVMNGIACTQKIRKFEKEKGLGEKPIIALTANISMTGLKNDCKNAGCTDYASKPIDYPQLQSLVLKYCRNK